MQEILKNLLGESETKAVMKFIWKHPDLMAKAFNLVSRIKQIHKIVSKIQVDYDKTTKKIVIHHEPQFSSDHPDNMKIKQFIHDTKLFLQNHVPDLTIK